MEMTILRVGVELLALQSPKTHGAVRNEQKCFIYPQHPKEGSPCGGMLLEKSRLFGKESDSCARGFRSRGEALVYCAIPSGSKPCLGKASFQGGPSPPKAQSGSSLFWRCLLGVLIRQGHRGIRTCRFSDHESNISNASFEFFRKSGCAFECRPVRPLLGV